MIALCQEVLRLLVELFEPQAAPILDLHAKSADGAQAVDRRWREHRDEGFFDCAVLLIERSRDGAGRERLGFALLEGLQRHEYDAGVGTVGESVDAEARESHRVIDARLLHGDLTHAADHSLRAVEGRRIRQLRETHQVLLVLGGNETRRRACEAHVSQRDQSAVYKECDAAGAHDAAHPADIALGEAREESVERAEETAEQPIEDAGQAIGRGTVLLEEQGGQSRREREGVERRDHRANRDGQGELFIELAGEPADESGGHEHGAEHQRRRDDGTGHLAHRLAGRLDGLQAVGDIALDVLDDHDGIVDDNADGEHQAEERQRVQAEAKEVHDREGADERHGYGDQGNDGGTPGLQKDNDDQHHQQNGLEQRVHHGVDGTAHEDRGVIDDLVVDALRKIVFQLLHFRAHELRDRDRIAAGPLKNRNGRRRLVVEKRAQRIGVGAELDACDVFQARDLTGGAGLDDDAAKIILGSQAAFGVDRHLEFCRARQRRGSQLTRGDLYVLLADSPDNIIRGEAATGDLLRIEPDAHGELAGAEHLHVPHTVQASEFVLDTQQCIVRQVQRVVAIVRRDQVHDHGQIR